MAERLQARKFWVTVLTGTVLLVADALDVKLDEATVQWVVVTVVGYVLGQGYADGKKALAEAPPPSSEASKETES